MQYKETVAKITTGLQKGFLFLILMVFFLLSLSFFSSRVSAQSFPNATFCPSDWRAPAFGRVDCCQVGSSYGTEPQNEQSKASCFSDRDGTPTDKIVGTITIGGEFFCPDNSLRLKVSGINKCVSVGTRIDSLGKFFVGCRQKDSSGGPRQASPQIVTRTSSPGFGIVVWISERSPNAQLEFPFCYDEEGGYFVNDRENCLCANGSEVAPPSGGVCEDVCGAGNVLYDSVDAGFVDVCSGSECCEGDQQCLTCVGETTPTGRIYTSLGCIDPTREGIVVWLIRIALILTTAIGVFRFIQASFLIRSGDPEKIKEGQEIVTSAIIALVLVLLSVPLLQFIGVNVLGIFPEGFI